MVANPTTTLAREVVRLALTVRVVLSAAAKVVAVLDVAGATTPQVVHRGLGRPNTGTLSPVLLLFGERTLMPPRGGVNRRDDQIKLILPKT
jgi:hypothetical protein